MKFLRKRHCFAFFLSLTLLFFSEKLFSQEINSQFSFHHYTEEDGLSNQQIICLLQDRSGFLWIGTQDGLFRYDGYEFKVFRSSTSNLNSIPQNYITVLSEDADGNIWIGTNSNGLCSFNPKNEKIIRYTLTGKNASVHSGRINSIACTGNRKIFATCDLLDGIFQFNETEKKFTAFYLSDFDKQLKKYAWVDKCASLFLLGNDTLFVGTGSGLFSIDLKKNELKKWKLAVFDKQNENAPLCQTIRKNPFTNELWIGTWGNGVINLNVKTGNSKHYWYSPVPQSQLGNHNIIFDFDFLSAHEIFVAGADKEFCLLNDETGEFNFFHHDNANQFSAPDGNCDVVVRDKNGIFWMGFNNGLVSFNPQANRFHNIYLPEVKYHISPFDITESPDGNKIFVTTYKGSGNYLYNHDGKFIESLKQLPELNGEFVSTSCVNDEEGNTWFSSYSKMYKYNWQTGRLTNVMSELNSETPYAFRFLNKGANGNFVFQGGEKKIYLINPESEKIILEKQLDYPLADSSQVTIVSIKLSPANHYWVAFHYAVIEYDSGFNLLQVYPEKINDTTFVGQGFINDLCISPDGKIYCVSTDGGLSVINPEKQTVNDFSSGYALSPMRSNAVTNDKSGIVWIASEQGLVSFNPSTETFTNYSRSDGLPHSQIKYVKAEPSGKVFYFFDFGWGWIFPEEFLSKKNISPVRFTALKVNEKKFGETEIDFIDEIELRYSENNLSLEFSLLDFTNPRKNTYAYKMEGVNDNWVMSETRHQVNYSSLVPGVYTFKVKAADGDGAWSNIRSLKIIIETPYWQTWWFKLLIILLIASMILTGIQIRLRIVRREEKLKSNYQKKISELETKALRAQMNPHFIFNCLNSINSFILRNDTEVASEYLTKFSRLIRLVLDNSRTSQITLSSELECLKLFIEMEEMRFSDKFEYSIHVSENVNPETIKVPPLIFQPYVENSIWHGLLHKNEKGKLKIEINRQNDFIICVIEDNGIGREAARDVKSKSSGHRKSHGMGITSQRVIEWNQNGEQGVYISDLMDAEKKPAGTRVEIKLKIFDGER